MTDIFKEASTQTPAPAQEVDAATTKLQSIVNEQGQPKYADIDTALDALKHSQDFIPSLKDQVSKQESEIAQLREQVAHQSGVQEALDTFAKTNAQPEQQMETPPAQLGEQDLESLVQNMFQAQEQKTIAQANSEAVRNTLTTQYGDKAVEHIQNKAKELNTTTEALEEMAKTNPTMALQLLGASAPKQSGMTYGGTNTTGFQPNQPEALKAPTESLLLGAKASDVKAFMAKCRDEVYKEHGINQ